MYARSSRWIPAHPDVVATQVDDPDRWAAWLPVAESGRLHTAGRPVAVTWHRAPDERGVRVWRALADDQLVATLRVAVVRWGEGTQVQLEVDRPGVRRGAWWTGQLLGDALHRLERHVGVAPRSSRAGAPTRRGHAVPAA